MMSRKARYWLCALFVLTLIYFAFLYARSSVPMYELGLKANKYISLNVNKNRGARKQLLEYAKDILQFYPKPHKVSYQKSDAGVGAEASLTAQFEKHSNNIIKVKNESELLKQFRSAKAGDIIWLEPGIYKLSGKRFPVKHAGTESQKITLMAERFDTVFLQLDSVEGLYLDKAHWRIYNLIFEGVCQNDTHCEHAIHITGDADNIDISHNRFINFNAHIKSNGKKGRFPDNITVSHNDFYNEWPRNTKNPVTPIDVVGGNDWLIANNFIADFALKIRDKFTVSYGAFLKGSGQRGKIEGNVVNCAWNVPHQSFLDIRIGLSLGGGGTGGAFCQEAACDYEHKDGVIENNLILNCQNDVSIYLNKASDSEIKNNILLNSLGIDARFAVTSATLTNNQYQGRILARDGAWIRSINNNNIALEDMPTRFVLEN